MMAFAAKSLTEATAAATAPPVARAEATPGDAPAAAARRSRRVTASKARLLIERAAVDAKATVAPSHFAAASVSR